MACTADLICIILCNYVVTSTDIDGVSRTEDHGLPNGIHTTING